MTDQEVVVNLQEEILEYAAAKNHVHDAAASVTTDGTDPVQSKGIVSYVTNKIANFKTESQIITLIENKMVDYVKTSSLSDTLNNYLSKNDAAELYATKNEVPTDINIYANPIQTSTKINYLVEPGYYIYTGTDATFYCQPDNVHYTNGLIRVETQSNHIIQHVYATSYSTSAQKYKIDGREFVRYGYTSTENNETKPHWEDKWRVANIPWKKRNDLLKTRGEKVSENGFSIYECTAGYVFQWKQAGSQQAYVLPMDQYNFASVYTFKDLPITSPFVFGNLIGHIDIKITENDFRVRSVNKRNEKIIGVNESYFVPRTN